MNLSTVIDSLVRFVRNRLLDPLGRMFGLHLFSDSVNRQGDLASNAESETNDASIPPANTIDSPILVIDTDIVDGVFVPRDPLLRSEPSQPSSAQPGGTDSQLPKTDRLDRPSREAREATEPERPWPYGTPIGGQVREPGRVLSKKEAEEKDDDVLIIRDEGPQDETLEEAPGPDRLFEKPASPAQPARHHEQEEPDHTETVTPVAPAGSQLPPLPPSEQPAPAPIPTAPAETREPAAPPAEPEPELEAEPDERKESAVEPAPAPIEFAAHYPREIKPGPDEWQPLLAYLYRATAADAVEADARERLGPRPDVRVTRRPALSQVQEGALVIATPDVPGLEFNPPSAVIRFVKDWHRFEFEFRATDAPLDEAANGRITFMVEGLIVGDVPLSVYVTESAASADTQVTQSHPYRAIFCSYSHKDTAIVELVELAMRTLGDQYLRDATTLRSGEDWNAALMRMIDAADIFQLFWSENAAGSKFVEEEWRYALSLKASQAKDDHFLRPVRWVDPIAPNPPDVLSRIEFFYEPRLLHWQQIEPGDPQPPPGLHPGGSGTD